MTPEEYQRQVRELHAELNQLREWHVVSGKNSDGREWHLAASGTPATPEYRTCGHDHRFYRRASECARSQQHRGGAV